MSERRALLDPDMYKISEEDSQDEEVISSRSIGNLTIDTNHNPGIVAGQVRAARSDTMVNIQPGRKTKLRTVLTLPSVSQSLTNGSKRKLFLEHNTGAEGGGERNSGLDRSALVDRLGWPVAWGPGDNSVSDFTDSDSSDTASTRSISGSSERGPIGSPHSNSSSSSTSRSASRDMSTRHHHRRSRRNSSNAHEESSTCSSCDSLPDRESDNGSLASESDIEDHLDDNSPHYITESEILSRTNEKGNVLLVEFYGGQESSSLPSTPLSPDNGWDKCQGSNSPRNTGRPPLNSKLKGNLERNHNDLPQNPSDSFQELKNRPEPKSGQGRISRFLGKNRADKPGSGTDDSKLKGKSRKVKMFRFKDEDEGEIRLIEMNLTSWGHRSNLGRRASLCESLLGIVPGRFSVPVTSPNSSTGSKSKKKGTKWEMEDDRIMVAGFIPDGPAMRTRHVKIGDWLRSINGNSVNVVNIDNVLASIGPQHSPDWPSSHSSQDQFSATRVSLGLQRVAGSLINEENSDSTQKVQVGAVSSDEVKGVSKTSFLLRNVIPVDAQSRIALLYISTPTGSPHSTSTQEAESSKEVVFRWPLPSGVEDWRHVERLVGSQGMFATLYGLLRDVTGSHPLLSKVEVGTDVMEVAYWSDNCGESLLLLAITVESQGRRLRAPSSTIPAMDHICSAISYKWGTLERAFTEITQDEMDWFLCNTLAPVIGTQPSLFMSHPMMLSISPSAKVIVDERLFSFEALDFYNRKFREERRGRRREADEDVFHCRGSCLFFKEKLVISHLEGRIQVKLYGWMMSELNKWSGRPWEPMKRVILWQRTFLSDDKEPNEPSCCYSVLVGVEDLILAFILDPVVPRAKKRGPDVLWIQKALKTVAWLARGDIASRINHDRKSVELLPWNFKNGPANSLTPSNAKKKNVPEMIFKGGRGVGAAGSILKNKEVLHQSHFQIPGFSPSLRKSNPPPTKEKGGLALISEEFSATSESINESFEDHEESTTGTGSDVGSFKCESDRSLSGEQENSLEANVKPISVMKGNVLFHFVQMEFGLGIILCSVGLQEGSFPELFDHFCASADVTYQILQRAANARMRLRDQDNDKKWVSRSLAPICEHGILFRCQVADAKAGILKNKTKMIEYWVVGRLHADKRVTFLCYQDTVIPQNHIECAFRLAHSL